MPLGVLSVGDHHPGKQGGYQEGTAPAVGLDGVLVWLCMHPHGFSGAGGDVEGPCGVD